MHQYCILIEGEFEMAYLRDLRKVPCKMAIRRIESEMPAYFIVECADYMVSYLYDNYLWIKRIERDEPMPVFWNDWEEEFILK